MQLSAPETSCASEGIAERLAALGPLIAELEEKRGDALLRGDDFDAEKLSTLRREQADLECVLAAATRRDRAAAEDARQAQRRLAQREIRKQEQARLDAVERAEQAATALVAALEAMRNALTAISAQNARLGNGGLSQVSVSVSEDRISRRLTDMFRPLLGRAGLKYGALKFPNPLPSAGVGESWREAEERAAAFEIARATKETP
jgi:hypothetical protein